MADTWFGATVVFPLSPVSPVPRRPLAELLPRESPARLIVWLYAGYGRPIPLIARLLLLTPRNVEAHLEMWRFHKSIPLAVGQLRAAARPRYSDEIRAEVIDWRGWYREQAGRARVRSEKLRLRSAKASATARMKLLQPERFEMRTVCAARWRAQGLTFRAIGERLGVSMERARQLVAKHGRRMRYRRPEPPLLPPLTVIKAVKLQATIDRIVQLFEERKAP